MLKLIISIFFSSIFYQNANAEFIYLSRSTEGLMMGDAFTAVADDDATLFYNPAAMIRHNGATISLLNPTFEVPDVVKINFSIDNFSVAMDDRFENWPSTSEGIARKILGYPIRAQFGATPTIKMQHFALSLMAQSQTSIILENAVYPNLNIDYRLDRGFVAGYAFNLLSSKKQKLALGFGIKHMNRQGLNRRFDLFGTDLLQIASDSDNYKALRKNLGYSRGDGWGIDTGIEYSMKGSVEEFVAGLSFLDMGDTRFSREDGLFDVPDQEGSLNLGTSYSHDYGLLDWTVAFDLHNLIAPIDFGSKVHLGARLGIPFIDLYTGINGGYLSYGLGIDLWPFRLSVGFYGKELGSKFKAKKGERMVIDLKLLSFHAEL